MKHIINSKWTRLSIHVYVLAILPPDFDDNDDNDDNDDDNDDDDEL